MREFENLEMRELEDEIILKWDNLKMR